MFTTVSRENSNKFYWQHLQCFDITYTVTHATLSQYNLITSLSLICLWPHPDSGDPLSSKCGPELFLKYQTGAVVMNVTTRIPATANTMSQPAGPALVLELM